MPVAESRGSIAAEGLYRNAKPAKNTVIKPVFAAIRGFPRR
jgi:hypothetical protein